MDRQVQEWTNALNAQQQDYSSSDEDIYGAPADISAAATVSTQRPTNKRSLPSQASRQKKKKPTVEESRKNLNQKMAALDQDVHNDDDSSLNRNADEVGVSSVEDQEVMGRNLNEGLDVPASVAANEVLEGSDVAAVAPIAPSFLQNLTRRREKKQFR